LPYRSWSPNDSVLVAFKNWTGAHKRFSLKVLSRSVSAETILHSYIVSLVTYTKMLIMILASSYLALNLVVPRLHQIGTKASRRRLSNRRRKMDLDTFREWSIRDKRVEQMKKKRGEDLATIGLTLQQAELV
jgi:hypothetical protein